MATPLYHEIIYPGTAPIALASVPTGAGTTELVFESAAQRFTFTGSAPNASIGYPVASGERAEYVGDPYKLRFCSQSAATGVVQAFYFHGQDRIL
jgi:hypothetical protein